MVNSARSIIAAFCLAGGEVGWAVDLVAQAIPARLSLEMLVGGGRLQIEADEFQAVADGSLEGARILLPKRCRIAITGEIRSTYAVSGASDAPGDWLSRHEIGRRFNEQIEVRLVPPVAPDWEELMRSAPLRVTIGPGDQPLVEVLASSVLPAADAGWQVVRSGESIHTEAVQTRTLNEGRWVESAPTLKKASITPRYAILIGVGNEGRVLRHGRLDGPEFVFDDDELRVPRAMTANRLIAGGEILASTDSDSLPGVQGGFGKTPVVVRWQLSVGQAPDVGWFEEVAAGRKDARWPVLGGDIPFVIKLTQPGLVEEVQAVLENVSRHPGVALNGGAALARRPPGWTDQVRSVPVSFQEDGYVLRWDRSEVVPPGSPEDSAPDLYFGEAGDPASTLLLKPLKNEIPLRVRASDWGGSGKLKIRVKVEGIWEELPARGAGVSGSSISIPHGAGADGVPADFEKSEGDVDGDGLSRAQEYRGVIVGGQHRRLSPLRREVFLADPSRCVGEEERIALGRRLSPWNVDLLFLEPGETAIEGVSVIVLEDLNEHFLPALLRLEDGGMQRKALRAIRPRPGCGALFVDGKVDPVLLAGDLALVLGLSEFGPEP